MGTSYSSVGRPLRTSYACLASGQRPFPQVQSERQHIQQARKSVTRPPVKLIVIDTIIWLLRLLPSEKAWAMTSS